MIQFGEVNLVPLQQVHQETELPRGSQCTSSEGIWRPSLEYPFRPGG